MTIAVKNGFHQLRVYQQPCRFAVAVHKGVALDKVDVYPGGPFHGMQCRPLLFAPFDEGAHRFRNLQVSGGDANQAFSGTLDRQRALRVAFFQTVRYEFPRRASSNNL